MLFRSLGLLLLLFMFDGPYFVVSLLGPFVGAHELLERIGLSGASYPPGFSPDEPWRLAWFAGTGILIGGSMLTLFWRPRTKPLLLQFIVAGMLLLALAIIYQNPSFLTIGFTLVVAVIVPGILVVLYPGGWRSAVSFVRDRPPSLPLLGLSALAAIPLGWDLWRSVQQGSDFGVQILLVLAGVMAATGRFGWQPLGIIGGLAFSYLGLAAIALPMQEGSWGVVGGGLSILAGVALVALTLYESSKPSQAASFVAPP